jgi:hypothetical protein
VQKSARRRLGILAATLPLMAAPLLASPAAQAATTQPSPDAPAAEQLVSVGSVTVDTYTTAGALLDTETYGPETEGLLMDEPTDPTTAPGSGKSGAKTGGVVAMASGNGGDSTASGCRRVTVNNEYETLLGFTAYYFHTWTRWCWTRSTQNVYDVTSGWTISDVDATEYWRGIVNTELGLYDYSVNDGHPRSAYKNYRQGHFENCVIKYGCISNTYPANTLRSYYNGTWAWSTEGT